MLPSDGNLGFISLAVELWLVADYHFGVAIPQTLVNEGSLVRGWQVYLIESHPNMYPSVLKRSLIETQLCSSMTFPAVNLHFVRFFSHIFPPSRIFTCSMKKFGFPSKTAIVWHRVGQLAVRTLAAAPHILDAMTSKLSFAAWSALFRKYRDTWKHRCKKEKLLYPSKVDI